MNIEVHREEERVLLVLKGRLDVAWAETFRETVQTQLRQGRYHLRVDAGDLTYLSSAGIRALVQVGREVSAVRGTFLIRNPAEMVEQVLRMSGLSDLLEGNREPEDNPPPGKGEGGHARVLSLPGFVAELSDLEPSGGMSVDTSGSWRPWHPASTDLMGGLDCSPHLYALGLGGPGNSPREALETAGEFLAAAGCVSWLPAHEGSRPDYLLAQEAFTPRVHALSALTLTGSWTRVLRFHPQAEDAVLPLSLLSETLLQASRSGAVAFLVLAETEGLVGASLIRNPDQIPLGGMALSYPESRRWLSFCGERVHGGQTALVLGMACFKGGCPKIEHLLAPSFHQPGQSQHVHAVVFPFTPLPSGRFDAAEGTKAIYQAHEPLDVLHLLEDTRPGNGLGDSALLRGICWFAPLGPKGEVMP